MSPWIADNKESPPEILSAAIGAVKAVERAVALKVIARGHGDDEENGLMTTIAHAAIYGEQMRLQGALDAIGKIGELLEFSVKRWTEDINKRLVVLEGCRERLDKQLSESSWSGGDGTHRGLIRGMACFAARYMGQNKALLAAAEKQVLEGFVRIAKGGTDEAQ